MQAIAIKELKDKQKEVIHDELNKLLVEDYAKSTEVVEPKVDYEPYTTQQMFHVSLYNHDGYVFKPRVPDVDKSLPSMYAQTIKRICFATTISGAFDSSMFYNGFYGGKWYSGSQKAEQQTMLSEKKIYVHVPYETINPCNIITNEYIRDHYIIHDAHLTGELWILVPVTMRCIGYFDIVTSGLNQTRQFYNNDDMIIRSLTPFESMLAVA